VVVTAAACAPHLAKPDLQIPARSRSQHQEEPTKSIAIQQRRQLGARPCRYNPISNLNLLANTNHVCTTRQRHHCLINKATGYTTRRDMLQHNQM
jgi:hypothetical protein